MKCAEEQTLQTADPKAAEAQQESPPETPTEQEISGEEAPEEIPGEEPLDEDEEPDEDDDEPRRNPLKGLLLWLLLVAVAMAVLLAAAFSLLYSATDESAIPSARLTFAEQEIEPCAYDWKIPVVGFMNRSFTKEDSGETVQLDTVTVAVPALAVSDGYRLELTVVDEAGNIVFEGSGESYAVFRFEKDGDYTALATATRTQGVNAKGYVPQGVYNYRFGFHLSVLPQLSISRESVVQGSAFSLRLSGALSDTPPRLEAEFAPDATFAQRGNEWIACLDVPYDYATGNYEIRVTSGDNLLTQNVHIYGRQSREIDTSTLDGTAAWPYVGKLPSDLQPYMEISDPDIYWSRGFVQPVRGTLLRDFGVTEYTDRITDPALIALVPELVAQLNAAVVPRLSLNVTFQLPAGTKVQCPADGRVVYAGVARGGGRTVVVEHGCGLKSIFYLMNTLAVEENDSVSQGQTLGTSNAHIVCEMRLNGTQINPWDVWRNLGGLYTF